MPEDKKKQLQKLQALAAKRKADGEVGLQKKAKAAAAPVPAPKKVSLKNGDTKPRLSPISKGKEKQNMMSSKAKSPVKRKAETWDSDSDTSEEDDGSAESEGDLGGDASDDDDDDNDALKSAKKSGKAVVKPPPVKKPKPSGLSVFKEKDRGKGIDAAKDKGKGKKKVEDNSDDDNNLDKDDGGDLSEDPLDEVDPSNILPSRTRRHTAQPVQYDFGNGSGDDSEDDTDA